MRDETGVRGVKSAAGAALLESMQAAQQALMRPSGPSPDQMIARLQEWQQLVMELSKGAARGTELATLYEIIGVLNSSLDLKETLSLVMDSLIHLTEAERGCLMLLDEEGNLEIQAAQHFDQESVDASDLELSQTVVRDTVEGGEPVLTTNAQLDPRFSAQDSVIGYMLRSIVCVPLHVRGRVIGALYLDNRARDGVFSQVDLPILMAFASQAAIAIENARLYTITNEKLAARLEELTTMQEIDRELNASLDYERVLDLTLSWAMRSTGAEKGTLSILDGEGTVCTVSCAGDGGATEPESDVLQLAMTSREPVMTNGKRMLIPIRYKERTVGLLCLRSNRELPAHPESVQFAGRLADHAAVAIENARLYGQVREANQAKSEFISCVSHELRTPMTSIRGYAEMLEKGMVGSLSSQQTEFTRTIRRNAERMQVLVSDLQDVSRIETGQLRLEMGSAAVTDALDSALQATQAQIQARSQHLKVDMPDDLPPVHADRARLAQILINLLSNAYKYTPKGGHIGVRAQVQGTYVQCAVSDTGIGMSPQDQQCLFTKFFRSEDPAVRETTGTGLGLCIVKSLVELQGGEIEVESDLGKGTTVTFTIPVSTEGWPNSEDP
ncbi:MAG TPA: ATP-binding protein [Anaerolineae bacterium]|nr:ATP-binding protein [Anaerolineae bacterium]